MREAGLASLADPLLHALRPQNYWTFIAGLVEMPLSDGPRAGGLGVPSATGKGFNGMHTGDRNIGVTHSG